MQPSLNYSCQTEANWISIETYIMTETPSEQTSQQYLAKVTTALETFKKLEKERIQDFPLTKKFFQKLVQEKTIPNNVIDIYKKIWKKYGSSISSDPTHFVKIKIKAFNPFPNIPSYIQVPKNLLETLVPLLKTQSEGGWKDHKELIIDFEKIADIIDTDNPNLTSLIAVDLIQILLGKNVLFTKDNFIPLLKLFLYYFIPINYTQLAILLKSRRKDIKNIIYLMATGNLNLTSKNLEIADQNILPILQLSHFLGIKLNLSKHSRRRLPVDSQTLLPQLNKENFEVIFEALSEYIDDVEQKKALNTTYFCFFILSKMQKAEILSQTCKSIHEVWKTFGSSLSLDSDGLTYNLQPDCAELFNKSNYLIDIVKFNLSSQTGNEKVLIKYESMLKEVYPNALLVWKCKSARQFQVYLAHEVPFHNLLRKKVYLRDVSDSDMEKIFQATSLLTKVEFTLVSSHLVHLVYLGKNPICLTSKNLEFFHAPNARSVSLYFYDKLLNWKADNSQDIVFGCNKEENSLLSDFEFRNKNSVKFLFSNVTSVKATHIQHLEFQNCNNLDQLNCQSVQNLKLISTAITEIQSQDNYKIECNHCFNLETLTVDSRQLLFHRCTRLKTIKALQAEIIDIDQCPNIKEIIVPKNTRIHVEGKAVLATDFRITIVHNEAA
ncbi:Uncharacterized protein PRO82_001576 [Candidatus Protochlamydia amoebophila]|uniref:hypothetical protein n=1 Tax=Candidatus Protochlamydia amoebophila TaxID=362787 RepID=UPI001BC94617|nr:hypothetical protein [Candidatus Protochlamydia amoebophila]MBS4164256.1 Uncharacterized protein [Candidatus Protochlamydia amoebophila]